MQEGFWQVNSNKWLSGFYKPHVASLQSSHAWAWWEDVNAPKTSHHCDKLPRRTRACDLCAETLSLQSQCTVGGQWGTSPLTHVCPETLPQCGPSTQALCGEPRAPEASNVSCKEPKSKYFRLGRPCTLDHTYSTPPYGPKHQQRAHGWFPVTSTLERTQSFEFHNIFLCHKIVLFWLSVWGRRWGKKKKKDCSPKGCGYSKILSKVIAVAHPLAWTLSGIGDQGLRYVMKGIPKTESFFWLPQPFVSHLC